MFCFYFPGGGSGIGCPYKFGVFFSERGKNHDNGKESFTNCLFCLKYTQFLKFLKREFHHSALQMHGFLFFY